MLAVGGGLEAEEGKVGVGARREWGDELRLAIERRDDPARFVGRVLEFETEPELREEAGPVRGDRIAIHEADLQRRVLGGERAGDDECEERREERSAPASGGVYPLREPATIARFRRG